MDQLDVDTAAQGGLIGKPALERPQQRLQAVELRIQWMHEQAKLKWLELQLFWLALLE